MGGTNLTLLGTLQICYEPNRSKVSRKLSAKCHKCRIL